MGRYLFGRICSGRWPSWVNSVDEEGRWYLQGWVSRDFIGDFTAKTGSVISDHDVDIISEVSDVNLVICLFRIE